MAHLLLTECFFDFTDLKDIVFIVLSQPNEYHVQRAQLFKEEFNMQLEKFKNVSNTIIIVPYSKLYLW